MATSCRWVTSVGRRTVPGRAPARGTKKGIATRLPAAGSAWRTEAAYLAGLGVRSRPVSRGTWPRRSARSAAPVKGQPSKGPRWRRERITVPSRRARLLQGGANRPYRAVGFSGGCWLDQGVIERLDGGCASNSVHDSNGEAVSCCWTLPLSRPCNTTCGRAREDMQLRERKEPGQAPYARPLELPARGHPYGRRRNAFGLAYLRSISARREPDDRLLLGQELQLELFYTIGRSLRSGRSKS